LINICSLLLNYLIQRALQFLVPNKLFLILLQTVVEMG
jgi:hypothetical protein